MHKIMQLKEELLEELKEYAGRKKTKDDLVCIKYLASSCDHLCNIVKDAEEEEDYGPMSRRSYESSGRRSYDSGMSGQRRDGRGRYAVERGRAWSYSDGPDDEAIHKLEELKGNADENTRRVIDKALRELRG